MNINNIKPKSTLAEECPNYDCFNIFQQGRLSGQWIAGAKWSPGGQPHGPRRCGGFSAWSGRLLRGKILKNCVMELISWAILKGFSHKLLTRNV